jgi:hypothetical protein
MKRFNPIPTTEELKEQALENLIRRGVDPEKARRVARPLREIMREAGGRVGGKRK